MCTQLTCQPIFTVNAAGEMEEGGINHVYMPQVSDLTYFGYGT